MVVRLGGWAERRYRISATTGEGSAFPLATLPTDHRSSDGRWRLAGWLEWRRPSDWLTRGKVWATPHTILLFCCMRLGGGNTSCAFFGGLNFLSLTPTASSAVFSYFHLTANNRRTPCLRQHCRCQRWRQGYPGHWCRCRCSGKPSGRLFACVTFVKVWDCETEHGKATQCHGHSRRACSRQCNQALEGSNCDRDTHSLIVYGRNIGAQ